MQRANAKRQPADCTQLDPVISYDGVRLHLAIGTTTPVRNNALIAAANGLKHQGFTLRADARDNLLALACRAIP